MISNNCNNFSVDGVIYKKGPCKSLRAWCRVPSSFWGIPPSTETTVIPAVHECVNILKFLNNYVWLRITDEGSVPEMRIWSIFLIKSDLKWWTHLNGSLYLYYSIHRLTCQKCKPVPLLVWPSDVILVQFTHTVVIFSISVMYVLFIAPVVVAMLKVVAFIDSISVQDVWLICKKQDGWWYKINMLLSDTLNWMEFVKPNCSLQCFRLYDRFTLSIYIHPFFDEGFHF